MCDNEAIWKQEFCFSFVKGMEFSLSLLIFYPIISKSNIYKDYITLSNKLTVFIVIIKYFIADIKIVTVNYMDIE